MRLAAMDFRQFRREHEWKFGFGPYGYADRSGPVFVFESDAPKQSTSHVRESLAAVIWSRPTRVQNQRGKCSVNN